MNSQIKNIRHYQIQNFELINKKWYAIIKYKKIKWLGILYQKFSNIIAKQTCPQHVWMTQMENGLHWSFSPQIRREPNGEKITIMEGLSKSALLPTMMPTKWLQELFPRHREHQWLWLWDDVAANWKTSRTKLVLSKI